MAQGLRVLCCSLRRPQFGSQHIHVVVITGYANGRCVAPHPTAPFGLHIQVDKKEYILKQRRVLECYVLRLVRG